MYSPPRTGTILTSRYRTIAFLLAICSLAVTAHFLEPSGLPPLGVDILHSLHGPGFAVLALLLLWFLQTRFKSVVNYFLAGAVAMAIGLVAEILQIPGPRNAQIDDLIVDTLGVTGALGIAAAFDNRVRVSLNRWARMMLPAGAGIALGIACLPFFWFSYALLKQTRQFPVLLTFERSWEQATLSRNTGGRMEVIAKPLAWPTHGNSVAKFREHGRWGIFLSVHPLPDWHGYSRLTFTAASATSQSVPMAVCIRSGEIRYCEEFHLRPQAARFTLQFADVSNDVSSKAFNFEHVDALAFSASSPGDDTSVYLDDIELLE